MRRKTQDRGRALSKQRTTSDSGSQEPSATCLASVSTGKLSAQNGLRSNLVTHDDLGGRAGISCLVVSLGIFNICCHLHTYNYVLAHVNRNSHWQLLLLTLYHVIHALLHPSNSVSKTLYYVLPFYYFCIYLRQVWLCILIGLELAILLPLLLES